MNRAGWIVTVWALLGSVLPAMAYEHHESLVNFKEFSDRVVVESKNREQALVSVVFRRMVPLVP